MMHHILTHLQQITAILPCYCEDGDKTLILRANGEKFLIDISVDALLDKLAHCHAVDLGALRESARKITHGHILQPLAFAPQALFCPMKIRKPEVKGDNCTGYINAHAVRSVDPDTSNDKEPQCTVQLCTGTTLTLCLSAAAVKKRLKTARDVESNAPYQQILASFREKPIKLEACRHSIHLEPGQDLCISLEIKSVDQGDKFAAPDGQDDSRDSKPVPLSLF